MIVYNLNPLALAATVFVFLLYLYRQYQHEQEEEEYDLIRRKKLYGKPYPPSYSESLGRLKDQSRPRPQLVGQTNGVLASGHDSMNGQPLKSLTNLSRERLDDLMAMEREKLEYLEKYSQIAFPYQRKGETEKLTQQKTSESFQTPIAQANVSKLSGPRLAKDSDLAPASHNCQQVPTVNYIVPSICSHCLKTHNPPKKAFKKKTTNPNVSNVIDFTDIEAFNKKDGYGHYADLDIQKLRKTSYKDAQEKPTSHLKKRPMFDFGVDMSRKGSQNTDKGESDSKMPVNFAKSVTFTGLIRQPVQENVSETKTTSQKPQPSLDISIIPHPSDETKTNLEKGDKSTADQTCSVLNTSINLFPTKKAEPIEEKPKTVQPSQFLFQPIEKKASPEAEKLSPNEPLFTQPKKADQKPFNLSAPDNNLFFKDFIIKPTDSKNLFSTPGSSNAIDLNVPASKTEDKRDNSEVTKPKDQTLFTFPVTSTETFKTNTLFQTHEPAKKSETTPAPLFPISTKPPTQTATDNKLSQYKVDTNSDEINFTQKPFGEEKAQPAKPLFENLNTSGNLFSFTNENKNADSNVTPKPDALLLNSQTSLDNKEEPKKLFSQGATQPVKDAQPTLASMFANTTPPETKPASLFGVKPGESPESKPANEPLFSMTQTANLFGNKSEAPSLSAKNEGLFGTKPTEGGLFGNLKPADANSQVPKTGNLFSNTAAEQKNVFTAPSFGNGKKSFDEENLESNPTASQQPAPVVNPFSVPVESKPVLHQEIINPFQVTSDVSQSKISDLVSRHTPSGIFNQSPAPAGTQNQQQEAKGHGNFFTGVTGLSNQQLNANPAPIFPFATGQLSMTGSNPFISSPSKPPVSNSLFGPTQESGGLFGSNIVLSSGLFSNPSTTALPFGVPRTDGQNPTIQSGWLGNPQHAQGSQLFGNMNTTSQLFGNNTGGNTAPGGIVNPFMPQNNK